MEGYFQTSDQFLDLCSRQCQGSGNVYIASRWSKLLHCRGRDICRVVGVSVGRAHDSSPFVRMCKNLPNVSEWNILVHNFAGASEGRLVLILVVLRTLVVAAAVFPWAEQEQVAGDDFSAIFPLSARHSADPPSVWSGACLRRTPWRLWRRAPQRSPPDAARPRFCATPSDSCHSSFRSLSLSLVERLKFATGAPLCEYLTSGSLPTFPTRIT